MDLGSTAILITGGTSDMGLALAARFLQAGSEVKVCGRREDTLREAQTRRSQLAIWVCNVAEGRERVGCSAGRVAEFPPAQCARQ